METRYAAHDDTWIYGTGDSAEAAIENAEVSSRAVGRTAPANIRTSILAGPDDTISWIEINMLDGRRVIADSALDAVTWALADAGCEDPWQFIAPAWEGESREVVGLTEQPCEYLAKWLRAWIERPRG